MIPTRPLERIVEDFSCDNIGENRAIQKEQFSTNKVISESIPLYSQGSLV